MFKANSNKPNQIPKYFSIFLNKGMKLKFCTDVCTNNDNNTPFFNYYNIHHGEGCQHKQWCMQDCFQEHPHCCYLDLHL